MFATACAGNFFMPNTSNHVPSQDSSAPSENSVIPNRSEGPARNLLPAPAPDFTAATQPSYARTLLLGPEGLRPGWGLTFYLLAFLILRWTTGRAAAVLIPPTLNDLWDNLIDESSAFAATVIPALILARIEKRPWKSYGLPLKQALGKHFWIGALWGFLGVTILLAALHGLHAFDFGHLVLHGVRIAKFAAYWAAMFLAVALAEEFLFRGYTQFTLTRGITFWPAAATLSLAFGGIHALNPGETLPGVLGAALIALFFCLTLRRTGTLWFAVGFHASWDWAQTFFYSVPDSGMTAPGHLLSSTFHGPSYLTGGTVGPEASLLCPIVIALLAITFSKIYPPK